MSRTFRKKFTSNKKQKSQRQRILQINTKTNLDNSWRASITSFKTLNLDDTEKQKKLLHNIFHSDNWGKYTRGRKLKMSDFYLNKIKSQRTKYKSLLKKHVFPNDIDLSKIETIYQSS